jgi:uncharacterized protein (DUF952 family)
MTGIKRLYHIMTPAAWEQAQPPVGWYAPAGFMGDGFIHCSARHQLLPVANAFFSEETELVVLEIDPAELTSEVRWESLEGGDELFPHIYGQLPWRAVSGNFRLFRRGSAFQVAAGQDDA